jgi:DNA-binding transcriptional LysR family regulator
VVAPETAAHAAGTSALLPMLTVEEEIARGDLIHIPVPELRFERKLRLVHRKNVELSHAGRALLAIAEDFARKRGGRFAFQSEK